MNYKFKAINRKDSEVRRENINQISKSLNINIELFEAIDYRYVLKNNSFINSIFKDADYWDWDINHWGVISCNLSHMMLWLECYNNDIPFFIFEDDIHLGHPIDFEWDELILRDFDVLILKGGPGGEFKPYCDSYCIKPNAAINIFQWFVKNGWRRTLDFEFEKLYNEGIFKIVSLDKDYFIQDRTKIKSDIAKDGLEYKKKTEL